VGAIRLFLALVVVIDHWRMMILQPAGLNNLPQHLELGMNAGFAVMFFYVISGFLISTALREKYAATMTGMLRFYQSRFIRIYSLYWSMLLLMLSAFGFWGWFATLSAGDKFTNLFVVGMDWRIMFASYPDWHWDASAPFFHQAWTLSAELTFYVVAPLLLRSWKTTLGVLLASAVVRGVLVTTTVFDGRWTYLFLPSTFLFFLIGHFAHEISQRRTILKNGACGALLLGCSLVCLQIGSAAWDSLQFWTASLAFAAALPGVFAATKRSSLLNALGDLSFPIYLVHVMVIGVFVNNKIVEKLPPSATIMTAAFIAAVVVAAVFAHWVFEMPTAAAMRWIIRRRDVPISAVRSEGGSLPCPVTRDRLSSRGAHRTRGFQ